MKPYFHFNRKEKIGVVTLSALILLLTVVLNVGSSTYVPDPFDVDVSKLDFLVLKESDSTQRNNNYSSNNSGNSSTYSAQKIEDFDPNTIGIEDWVKMGFSQKQAQSIMDYRQRFGAFKKKEDLKKLYVISSEKYLQLEPHIIIHTSEEPEIQTQTTWKTNTSLEVELNSATVEDLIRLRGIGEGYANRIVNYRTKIGGFVDFSQVEKVAISDDAKESLRQFGIIDPLLVSKTNINTATKEQLKAIPFSNWLVVASIIKQRETEPITNLNFLTEIEISIADKLKFEYYVDF